MASPTPAQQLSALHETVQQLVNHTIALAERAERQDRSRPKPCLPEPDKFNGTSSKWDTWLPSIKAKLLVDGPAIGNSTAQFYYVYLNLESSAQSLVLPQLSVAEATGTWNYQTLLDQLARAYDSPTKVQEAEDRLAKCSQGTDSVSTYIARFERLLYEARCQEWPDHTKIVSFRQGLNSTIRNRLAAQLSLPKVYSEYLSIVQQLSVRSQSHSHVTFGNPSSAPAGRPNTGYRPESRAAAADPMDLSAVGFSTIDSAPPEDSADKAAQIMAIENGIPASPKQRQRWSLQERCLTCGDERHYAAACPYGLISRPSSRTSSRASRHRSPPAPKGKSSSSSLRRASIMSLEAWRTHMGPEFERAVLEEAQTAGETVNWAEIKREFS